MAANLVKAAVEGRYDSTVGEGDGRGLAAVKGMKASSWEPRRSSSSSTCRSTRFCGVVFGIFRTILPNAIARQAAVFRAIVGALASRP